MRVLNFISGRNLGGSKQAFLDYSLMCHQLGHEVYSMIRTGSPLRRILRQMPTPVADNVLELNYIRSKLPGFRQWALKEFARVSKEVNPDIILVHKPIDLYFIRETFPQTGVIAVVHSFTANYLHHADRIFAVSEALKKYIISQGCDIPVSVINNAIEMPQVEDRPAANEIPVIGTMAVFRRTKRLDLLIRAFHQLKVRGVPFRGVIAGAGIQKLYLKFLIWRLKLIAQVELRGWVMDKDAFYREIDVFCISSRSETFSISLIEAMSRRKSVVATTCGGPEEIIDDQVDGLLTPVGNVEALAEKLSILISSKEYREQLADSAYRKVKSRYSSEVIKEKIDRELGLLTNKIKSK